LFFLDDLSGWQRYKTVFHETGLAPLSCLLVQTLATNSTTTSTKARAYMSGI